MAIFRQGNITIFDFFWRMVHCTNRQKHSKPLVYQSSQVYQDCTNSVPIVKNSQKQSKDSQNSKNNHWSTKTVPTVYQSSKTVKNSQKTVKTAKITIGVPIVTGLPRLYQQCTNNVPIVTNSQNSTKCPEYTKPFARTNSAAIYRMEIQHVPAYYFLRTILWRVDLRGLYAKVHETSHTCRATTCD